MLILLLLITVILSGCLGDEGGNDDIGVSALDLYDEAGKEASGRSGDLQLVVVTAMEIKERGHSMSWKYAYNDVTSGVPLSSFLITVSSEGSISTETDDPLSKSPIRNWTVDSITAFQRAKNKLIDEGIITSSVKVSIRFLYLLGEEENNNGCVWYLGLILGSEQPLEVTVKVDGRYGNVIEVIDPRN